MIPKPVMKRRKDFLRERLSVRAAMKPAVIARSEATRQSSKGP
jgi:hypothetical protein